MFIPLRRLPTILPFLGLAFLSACTPPPPLPGKTGFLEDGAREQALVLWDTNQKALASISHWHLRGKMGVKTGSKGGSATIQWQYAPDRQRIELYGPFGGGRIIIDVDHRGAVLKDTKGMVIEGDTAADVLHQRLGWQVPFDHLANWARGIPGEGAKDLTIDRIGRLQRMVQKNWQVEYQQFEAMGNTLPGYSLPRKLTVSALPGTMEFYSEEGKPLGDELRVRIILKHWGNIERTQL